MKVLIFFMRMVIAVFGFLCIGIDILAGIGIYQDKTTESGELIILTIILLVGLAALKIGLPPYTNKEKEEAQKRVEEALNHLVNVLIDKGFTFVTSDISPNHMQDQLTSFDQRRLKTYGKVFGFMISGYDMPGFVKTISKNVVGFGTEKIEDEELAALQQLMQSTFPVCAVAFNQLYGARFIAIVNGDSMTKNEVFNALGNED
ncbi:MAG: hypothetical protein AAGA80_07540 [Cyanobacteria bacterium P01_F01_bin.143]